MIEKWFLSPPKNSRLIHCYMNFLYSINIRIKVNSTEPFDVLAAINNYIATEIPEKSRAEFVSDLNIASKNNFIESDTFEWLNNKIASCYVWTSLINTTTTEINPNTGNFKYLYEMLFPHHVPMTESTHYKKVILFFDYWSAKKELKISLLDFIKNNYSFYLEEKSPFKWLNKNDQDMCDWAWAYFKNHIELNFRYDQPSNSIEKFSYLHAYYYYWPASKSEKELFRIKISKANSQLKFRGSVENKKSLNTYINEETKMKLDYLCNKKNKKINELIELLINKEYKEDKQS